MLSFYTLLVIFHNSPTYRCSPCFSMATWAATATLFKIQKPMQRLASAWWPGGLWGAMISWRINYPSMVSWTTNFPPMINQLSTRTINYLSIINCTIKYQAARHCVAESSPALCMKRTAMSASGRSLSTSSAPVHVSMSPRLRHEHGTKVVQVKPHVATLLQNSGSFNGRVACRKEENTCISYSPSSVLTL